MDRAHLAAAVVERRRAHDHLGGLFQHGRVVAPLAVHLPVGGLAQHPVVGDVVDAGPAGGGDHGGVHAVVDPEHRPVEPQLVAGRRHLAEEGAITAGPQAARQPLAGRHAPQAPTVADRPERRGGGPASMEQRPRYVDGRFGEQETQTGTQSQQAGGQMLIAPPHLVPWFEGAADDLGDFGTSHRVPPSSHGDDSGRPQRWHPPLRSPAVGGTAMTAGPGSGASRPPASPYRRPPPPPHRDSSRGSGQPIGAHGGRSLGH